MADSSTGSGAPQLIRAYVWSASRGEALAHHLRGAVAPVDVRITDDPKRITADRLADLTVVDVPAEAWREPLATLGAQTSVLVVLPRDVGVHAAVAAMRAGADDAVTEDDLDTDHLRVALHRLADHARVRGPHRRHLADLRERYTRLTPREREVADLLVAGNSPAEVAAKLERSVKTVAVHRAHAMTKLRTDSFAGLVRAHLLLHGQV